MSFKKSMKGSNRSRSAKGQRVADNRCSKSKGTFTMFRFDERKSEA